MKIHAFKVLPNTNSPEFGFVEVEVHFWEDETPPYRSAKVTIFIEISSLLLSDIETQAIEKARIFLRLAAETHSS